MKKTSLILSSICALAVVACGPSRTEQAENEIAEAQAEQAAAAPIELPPSITSSNTYRCKGGTALYIDYFGENVAAQIRVDDKNAIPTRVEPSEEAPTGPMVSADGSITLTGTGEEITIQLPEKGSLACKG